jgi:hypothetical protein
MTPALAFRRGRVVRTPSHSIAEVVRSRLDGVADAALLGAVHHVPAADRAGRQVAVDVDDTGGRAPVAPEPAGVRPGAPALTVEGLEPGLLVAGVLPVDGGEVDLLDPEAAPGDAEAGHADGRRGEGVAAVGAGLRRRRADGEAGEDGDECCCDGGDGTPQGAAAGADVGSVHGFPFSKVKAERVSNGGACVMCALTRSWVRSSGKSAGAVVQH